MEVFAECLAVLDRHENVAPGKAGAEDASQDETTTSAATRFLLALGYLGQDADTDLLDQGATEPRTAANRRALLRLAGKFERCFRLPLPHASGAHFFGAQLAHRAFGLERHGSRAVGVAGRGATFRRAFESCVGEAAEYLSILEPDDGAPCAAVEDDRRGCSDASILRQRFGPLVPDDDDLSWALSGVGLDLQSPLVDVDWVEAKSIIDQRGSLFPRELCWRRAPGVRKLPRRAETNGCAAGPTLASATLTALEEVVERDAIALWWFGGREARAFAPDLLDELEIGVLMNGLRGDTPRDHWFIDLTTEFGIPVVGALSAEPDGAAVIAGFSAGLDVRSTMISAALEMCQMELAQELALLKRQQDGDQALNELDRLWIDRRERLHVSAFPQLRPRRLSSLRPLTLAPDPLSACLERLQRFGLDAYRIDLARADIGVPVARILIPGLQSAKTDWRTRRLAAAAAANALQLSRAPRDPSPI